MGALYPRFPVEFRGFLELDAPFLEAPVLLTAELSRAAVTTRGNRRLRLNGFPEALAVICPQSLLIDSIGKELENLSFYQRNSAATMTRSKLKSEPYEISLRFHCALREKALRLEAQARKDELFAASLEHPGHLRRHNLLIQAQIEDAGRIRDFLADTRIRIR